MIAVQPGGQAVAVAALKAGLELVGHAAHVSTQKPDPTKHAQFVVVSRIGGGKSNIATSAVRLLVECYAHTETAAERLALDADAALEWTIGRAFVGRHVRWWACDDNLARFDDPNPSHSRFQFTGELSIAIT